MAGFAKSVLISGERTLTCFLGEKLVFSESQEQNNSHLRHGEEPEHTMLLLLPQWELLLFYQRMRER